ncbi:hypothetical protein EMIHUDRAFT_457825, partial [Emiliania huxleyi CCMP1516]|uniref:Uncharacterized protein n=2 Tax=Emiliania huxleyi TaxID=2903 RepID=A0A0D3JL31_EMIH1
GAKAGPALCGAKASPDSALDGGSATDAARDSLGGPDLPEEPPGLHLALAVVIHRGGVSDRSVWPPASLSARPVRAVGCRRTARCRGAAPSPARPLDLPGRTVTGRVRRHHLGCRAADRRTPRAGRAGRPCPSSGGEASASGAAGRRGGVGVALVRTRPLDGAAAAGWRRLRRVCARAALRAALARLHRREIVAKPGQPRVRRRRGAARARGAACLRDGRRIPRPATALPAAAAAAARRLHRCARRPTPAGRARHHDCRGLGRRQRRPGGRRLLPRRDGRRVPYPLAEGGESLAVSGVGREQATSTRWRAPRGTALTTR